MHILLYSYIITHGYFDILYFDNILFETLCYIITIFNIKLIYNIFPSYTIFATLFNSMIHFSNDFYILLDNSNYIYALFLGLLYTKDQMIHWLYILNYTQLPLNHLQNIITSIRYICMINSILFFTQNTILSSLNYITIMLMGQIVNPLNTITLYLALIHTPLSISRFPYTKTKDIFSLYLILMYIHILVLIVGTNLIKKNISIIVAVLNTHILFHLIK